MFTTHFATELSIFEQVCLPKKHTYIYYILVGGAITILKNMKVNGKDDIPFFIMENKSYVPNHQPVYITIYYHLWYY